METISAPFFICKNLGSILILIGIILFLVKGYVLRVLFYMEKHMKHLDNLYFSSYIKDITDDGYYMGKLSQIFIQ